MKAKRPDFRVWREGLRWNTRPLTASEAKKLDEYLPPAGPCGMCGGPDKRHRMTDAVGGRVRAGEPVKSIARDMDMPVPAVRFFARLYFLHDTWRIAAF